MCIRILLPLTLLLAALAPLSAQEKAPPPVPQAETLSTRVDIDFPGGTVIELLAHIAKDNGVTPNVIVSSEAAKLELPPIRVRSVPLTDFFQSLQQFQASENFMINVNQRSQDVLTVSARFLGPQAPRAPRSSRAYDVKSLLADFKIDDLVTAIETSWKMESAVHGAQLKYHEETSLLLVVGDMNELNTVDNILRELQKAQSQARQAQLQARQAQMQARYPRTTGTSQSATSSGSGQAGRRQAGTPADVGIEVAKLKRTVSDLEREVAKLNKKIAKLEAATK